MKTQPLRAVLFLAFVCSAAFATQPQIRTVYVSALDHTGRPLPRLAAADFTLTEDHQARQVLDVEPATQPLKIALLVNERGLWSAPLRQTIATLARTFRGWADIGLFSAGRPEQTVVDFSAESAELLNGLQGQTPITTSPQGIAEPSNLLQPIATQFRKQGAPRTVIVLLATDPSTADLGSNWDLVIREVQRSRTTVFAVGTERLSPMVYAVAEASGGRAETVFTQEGLPSAAKRVSDEILGQYAVTYRSIQPPSAGLRLRVTVNRAGVLVRAPERVGVR